MKVAILGTGDMTKIPRYTDINEGTLRGMLYGTAKLLADRGHDIVIIPDRGIPTEIAQLYKSMGGRRVWGVIPVNDKTFGDRHIQPYLPLIDSRIEVDSWYDADGTIAAAGDVDVVFGMSPGIMREISVLKYHYRYKGSKTRVIWFGNTISQRLAKEIEEEIPVTYISSVDELGIII
jgi:hypothetical protein